MVSVFKDLDAQARSFGFKVCIRVNVAVASAIGFQVRSSLFP
jgi:hypothetical protein